ncbi:MAG: hypothetical protein KDD32_01835 [Bacteroidetes bacterium]|nr:hypothetical protein [Bacteroidota bacterium]
MASAIVLSIVLRAFPHIPNMAPIAAIALFSGAYFAKKQWAFVITFLALFLSDAVLHIQYLIGVREFAGFYPNMIFVYTGIAMVIGIGLLMRNKVNAFTVLGGALSGSVLFYIISNFGVWLMGTMYSKTFAGLVECYVAGIPFYRGTLMGDVIYSALLFGAFGFILQSKTNWKLAKVRS